MVAGLLTSSTILNARMIFTDLSWISVVDSKSKGYHIPSIRLRSSCHGIVLYMHHTVDHCVHNVYAMAVKSVQIIIDYFDNIADSLEFVRPV